MSDDPIVEAIQLYRECLEATEKLYDDAAVVLRDSYAWLADHDAMSAADQMHDLHQGLVMKVYAWVAPTGAESMQQRQLGRILLGHIWNKPVMGSELREAIEWLIDAVQPFRWEDLVNPFLQVRELRNQYGQLMSLVMRMGNLVARSDGSYSPEETSRLESLQAIFDNLANNNGYEVTAEPEEPPTTDHVGSQQLAPPEPRSSKRMSDALNWLRAEAERLRSTADQLPDVDAEKSPLAETSSPQSPSRNPSSRSSTPAASASAKTTQPQEEEDPRTPEERLADARGKLDKLIGLDNIKHQIETLTNFLKMERLRAAQGLPTTQPSLHMAFVGNPGTGKTTVARIVAEIYGALGILEKGHLIETDRSGLVAEYAGQTGPKTNAKIDEALDGVLFIDEAYTMIDSSGQDQYGREAIQTLLKRMEDQRERLVVILAGYPVEMQMMIRSNPGLSSRVGTTLHFEDYTPGDMARIFGLMAGKAEYTLPTDTRRRLLYGFDYLFERRDRHFGNGRTVRNSFERSVRRLANRLATVVDVDRALLTTLQPEDIEVAGIEQAHLSALVAQSGHVRVACEHCKKEITISDSQLAVEISCPNCQQEFTPQWGDPVVVAAPTTVEAPTDSPNEAPTLPDAPPMEQA